MLRETEVLAGKRHFYDAAAARNLIEADMARATSFANATNHFVLVDDGFQGKASELAMPVLVIHGTDDPIFPIAHGQALAEVVRQGRLFRIDGGGHEIHVDDQAYIIEAIADFTA